ncbi:Pseudouridine synthase, 23S RNA-specific [Alteracholeplasma palmae J233]|uniref:Pseudouridine synthase n=1 Tax=Alteracholeplasma palmae (strain ATCC 49389 / J233) TaxID=1318466 RepID=U4KRX8_ALTPJ|nr:RluA family pseudouridine synthase [Alteracholeplasma palmae]CCV64536.1 Pseudouridine synthase, 23S RNA-specific [Alteracholeplasma palmae J233]
MKQFKITTDDIGQRLDHYLTQNLDLTRSRIQQLIKEEHILINDKKEKTGYILKLDDLITVIIPEVKTLELKPVDLKLDIVYEDSDILVVNKPQGLVVHPASSYNEPTLVHGLLHEIDDLSDINGTYRPGIVHRIDKDTSGLLVVAKTDKAHKKLSEDLKVHDVKREYIAIIYGHIEDKGKIDAPIGRHKVNRLKMSVTHDGKDAITHFETIERYKGYSLIRCFLETGRTHQIRVHLAYIGHPILGDPIYGPKKVYGSSGQYLHARKLSFNHPITNDLVTFEVDVPDNFKEVLKKIENEEI